MYIFRIVKLYLFSRFVFSFWEPFIKHRMTHFPLVWLVMCPLKEKTIQNSAHSFSKLLNWYNYYK